MTNSVELIGKIVIGIMTTICVVALLAGLGLLLAFPIKWTWNVTMPYLFGLPTLTWGKAWCIHFLAGCLIKSNHTHKSGGKND